ncbi:Integral membrane protein [Desulfosporosinus sp. BG]|nr:Integral membrane protein [Desulfosporosinus sp. BG]
MYLMHRIVLHIKQIPTKVYSLLAVVLLVIAMYTAAVILPQKEIIFPELAALAVGTWVLGNHRWLHQPLLICISPTLAAVTGIIIVHFLSQYQVFAILLAFVVVSIELSIMRSHVTPSISAAILPIFLRIDSLYYPLAVGVLTVIVAFPQNWSLLTGKEKLHVSQILPIDKDLLAYNRNFLKWLSIYAGVILITLFAFFIHWQFIVAPPLIVAFVEIIQHREGISVQRFRLLWLIGCSAVWGTFSMQVLYNMAHLSTVIVAAFSVIGVLLLFRFLKISFPPAMAIALLPTIIPGEYLKLYSLQVCTGAFLFVVLSWFYTEVTQWLTG